MKHLLVLVAMAQLSFAASPFHGRRDYTINPNGFLVVADVNGDGIPDLVENYVRIDFGNGDGTFRTGPSSATVDDFIAFQMGDFNGDGQPDILTVGVASEEDPQIVIGIAIMLSNGDGTFTPGSITETPSSPFSPQFALIGDFNGDGKLDVVIAETAYSGQGVGQASRLVTLIGKGDGTFAAPVNTLAPRIFPSGLESSHTIVTADFNGDGYPDVAVQTLNGIQVFLNNKKGGFQSGAFLSINSAKGLLGLAAADMNGDGKIDLVGDLGGGGGAFTALGNGNGTFQTPLTSVFPGEGQIAIGDVNGDGIPDLVAVQTYGVAVAFGNGNGTFETAATFQAGSLPGNLALADLRGTGRLDIVSGNSYSTSVLLNEGTGKFADTPVYPSGDPGCAAVAAFTGSGYSDVALNQSNGTVTVSLGTGDINSVFAGYKSSSLDQPGCAAAGDFNHDGKQDLVIVGSGKFYVDLGEGNGTFAAGKALSFQGFGPACVGDFNGDGNLDLAFSSGGIALGNGDGTFQPEIILPENLAAQTLYCAAADLNGDGITDLVLTDSDAGIVYVYLGNKSAQFEDQTYAIGGSSAIAIADFNGDGRPDIAVGSYSGVGLLLGEGGGTFSVGAEYVGPLGALLQCNYLLAGDFDNNGTIDLALPVPATGYIAILSGNGNGTFTSEDYLGGVSPMTGVALANLHGQGPGNGGPDIVQAGGSSLAVLVNTTPTN